MKTKSIIELTTLVVAAVIFTACVARPDYKDRMFVDSMLAHAVRSGDTKEARLLIGRGADVNRAVGSELDYNYMLRITIRRGDIAMAKLLVESGANPNARNRNGETPLLIAALEANTVQVELLKKYGARVDRSDRDLLTALFYCQACTGDLAGAAALLDMGVDPAADSVRGDLIVHKLIAIGRTDIIELLVSRGLKIEFDDKFYSCGFLPAIQAGHIGIVKYFVKRGADIDYFTSYDKTPIMQACENCRAEIAEYLIARGVKYYHMPDLLLAAMKNHSPTARMAEFLLDKGLDINYTDSNLQNALMLAIRPISEGCIVRSRTVNADLVRLLIRRGIDVNAIDMNGSTALSRAKAAGLKDIVKILENARAKSR